jgi:hypothetical protein
MHDAAVEGSADNQGATEARVREQLQSAVQRELMAETRTAHPASRDGVAMFTDTGAVSMFGDTGAAAMFGDTPAVRLPDNI